MRRTLIVAAVALLAAGCSSSGPAKPPSAAGSSTAGIGQPVAASSSGPAASAALGAPITQGSLTITVAGPATTAPDDAGLLATFHVTMKNTGASGDVVAPDSFGVRCDANRADTNPGDMMSSSTVKGDVHVPAGQTVTGTVVEAWLKWNSKAQCAGSTTIEARFLEGGYLSWTLPTDVVAQVNKAAA